MCLFELLAQAKGYLLPTLLSESKNQRKMLIDLWPKDRYDNELKEI